MTAPDIKAVGTTQYNSGASITIPLPAGWAAGDVAFALHSKALGSARTFVSATSGWTLIGEHQPVDPTETGCALWYRVLQGGDGDPTFTFSGNLGVVAGRIVTYEGIDTTNPISATAYGEKAVGASGSYQPATIGVTRPYSLLAVFGAICTSRRWSMSPSNPWSEAFRYEASTSPLDGNGPAGINVVRRCDAPGTYSPLALTSVGPSPYPEFYVWTIVIQPPFIHTGGGEAQSEGIVDILAEADDAPAQAVIVAESYGELSTVSATVTTPRRPTLRREYLWVRGLDGTLRAVIT